MLAYESGEQKHRCREFDKQFSNALSEKNMLALIERVAKPRRMWFRWAGKTGTSYPNKIFSKTSFGTWVYLSLWVLLYDKANMDLVAGSPSARFIGACMNACMDEHMHAHRHTCSICGFYSVQWVICLLGYSVVVSWCAWLCRWNWFLVQTIKYNATAFHCQNLQGYYLERKLMLLLNRFMDNAVVIEKKDNSTVTYWAMVLSLC